jgi:hypothetical protein
VFKHKNFYAPYKKAEGPNGIFMVYTAGIYRYCMGKLKAKSPGIMKGKCRNPRTACVAI